MAMASLPRGPDIEAFAVQNQAGFAAKTAKTHWTSVKEALKSAPLI
jgi:hypothetical protein